MSEFHKPGFSGASHCAGNDALAEVDFLRTWKDLDELQKDRKSTLNMDWVTMTNKIGLYDKTGNKIVYAQNSRLMCEKTDETSGRGYYALEAIKAGSIVLVEKPYLGILDSEAQRLYPEWADTDSADTHALSLQFSRECNSPKHALECAEKLHPSPETFKMKRLPEHKTSFAKRKAVKQEFEKLEKQLEKGEIDSDDEDFEEISAK